MRLRIVRATSGLILFLTLLVLHSTISAQDSDSSGLVMTARAGYDGFYKGEYWIPVHTTVSNEGASIEGVLRVIVDDASGSNEIVYQAPMSLPSPSVKRQTLFVQLPNFRSHLQIELISEDGVILETVESNPLDWLAADSLLYGVVTDEPGDLDFLEDLTADRSDAAVAYLDSSDLPESPAAWNALDVLIIHNTDASELNQSQLDSLKSWIESGGQLVVAAGPEWQATTDGLADLLPVTISSSQSIEDLPALQSFTGQSFRDPGPYVIATSTLKNGELLLHEDGLPILARRNLGRGAIYFLSLSPSSPPLADWDGSSILWQEVVSRLPDQPQWYIGFQDGFSANNAVSSLPSFNLPSGWQLFLFLLAYIIVMGPINYMVLRRIGRRELAWITIPGLVVIFSAMALLAGFRLKGNNIIINQMSVASGHLDGTNVRVQTILGLYSPNRKTFDLSFPAGTLARPFAAGYGELASGGNVKAILQGQEVVVDDIRVDVSGIEPLVADSYRQAPAVTGQVALRSEGGDLVLEANLQNNSQVNLENATILLGLTAIPLGDLMPGESAIISQPVNLGSGNPTGSGITSFAPVGPAISPLSMNYNTILGTSEYFSDPKAYARWQLLEALAGSYGSLTPSNNLSKATLIAWTDEEQLEVDLLENQHEDLATTVYFLEMPLIQSIGDQELIILPKALLNWQILAENGVFEPTINDLYLPPGWVEFEYEPWPEFQRVSVRDLKVVLQQRDTKQSQPLPRVLIWDWQQEKWVAVDNLNWGYTDIQDPLPYVGSSNKIRLRLQNDSAQGLNVYEVYPELSGTFE